MRERFTPQGLRLLAIGLALAICILALLAAGADPVVALSALLGGAIGDRFALADTLLKSCPLILTGLGVALAFRTGVWNIGAEGQLLVGALAATVAGTATSGLPFPLPLVLGLASGAGAGALWAGGAALLRVTRGVSEVLGTIMLNFVALRLVGWAVHGPLMEEAGRYPQSDALPAAALLPMLAGRLHAGILIAALAALAAWTVLFRTTVGFRWRAVGANPHAAAVAGFRPTHEIVTAMLSSGALAGLAGALEVQGVTGRLFEQFSAGHGYTAIAVALLGRLHPGGVVLAALFFGGLAAGSGSMQRVAGVSAVFVAIVQAVTVLALLALESPRLAALRGRRTAAADSP
jgi:simple sugar transport system permease protein